MDIQFTLDEADVVAFNMHHYARSPSARRRVRLFHVGIPIAYVLVGVGFVLSEPSIESISALIALALLAGIWLIGYPRWQRHYARKAVLRLWREGQNRSIFGNHLLSALPETLICTSPLAEHRYQWAVLERIEETPEYAFLYMGAAQAVVIPRNKITAGNYVEFFSACREYHAKATAAADNPKSKIQNLKSQIPLLFFHPFTD